MKLKISTRREHTRPYVIDVKSAWPNGSWLCYRMEGETSTHMIPESAVWEIELIDEPSDPDPMRRRTEPQPVTTPAVPVEMPPPS